MAYCMSVHLPIAAQDAHAPDDDTDKVLGWNPDPEHIR
jgi:hypothetical protein